MHFQFGNSVVLHSFAALLSAMLLVSFMIADQADIFVAVSFFYGLTYGAENTYIAINANALFGQEVLGVVMTANTFVPGVGYFIGSPVAGNLIFFCGA